ncbi:MIP family channel protein [Hyaloraphidium curvatum]|nr:MIP family channel protein [Hyaloraphidium curvatum]
MASFASAAPLAHHDRAEPHHHHHERNEATTAPAAEPLDAEPLDAGPREWRRFLLPYAGEFLGTLTLTLFGIMAVSAGVLTGSLVGTGQVAIVWGIGVALSIYTTASVSGAHLNPAVTFMFALFKRYSGFPWARVPGYFLAQFLGAFVAGLLNWAMYYPYIDLFDATNGIVKGTPESALSAMVLPQYFPNQAVYTGLRSSAPASFAFPTQAQLIGPGQAFFAEALGTAILCYVIVALTDRCNTSLSQQFAPMLIGLTVTALICTLAPISQAGFNPARDFGTRVVAYIAGWGAAAIPGPQDAWWVYVVAPFVGAPVGAGVFFFILRKPDEYCELKDKCE